MCLTYGGIRRGPACSQKWCAPYWWFLGESPPRHWSSPTSTSAWRAERKCHSYRTFQMFPDVWCESLRFSYIHAFPQVSHVCFLRLNQLSHDEPRHTHTKKQKKHTGTSWQLVILSSFKRWIINSSFSACQRRPFTAVNNESLMGPLNSVINLPGVT